jgi:hypothetical protein
MLQNREQLPEIGKRAREFVEKELNPEIHFNKLVRIYEMAMSKIRKAY